MLLRELGSGGFADVYKARHIGLGYIRAIRILRQFVPDEASPIYQKFLRECRVLLRLGNGCHPNIVHIYQPRLVEGKPLVEMDYVEGVDLKDYIAEQNGKVPEEEIVRMVREMGSALAYCHRDIYKVCYNRDEDNLQDDPEDGSKVLITEADERRLIEKYRVIHNDIQTRNIMRRSSDGMYVLLDFGLAVDGNGDVVGSSRMSKGAPEFKPPEKWDNEDLPTTQGDIYSFGCVVYAMITGRPPFPIDTKWKKSLPPAELTRVMMAHKEQAPLPIEREDVPQWLVELTMRCLEKDPARRYRDGYEMYQEILRHSQEMEQTEADQAKERLAALEAEKGGLLEALAAEQKENDEQKQQNESLQHDLAHITRSLQSEKEELKEQIGRQKEELGQRQDEINRLKDELENGNKIVSRRPKWWLLVLLTIVGFAAGAGAMTLLKKGGDIQGETAKYESRIKALQTENGALQVKVDSLENVMRTNVDQQVQDLRDKVDGLEQTNKALEERNNQLQNHVNTLAADNATLTAQNKKLQSEIKTLKNRKPDNSALEQKIRQLEQDKKNLQKKNSELSKENETLTEKNQKLENLLSDYIRKYGTLKKE